MNSLTFLEPGFRTVTFSSAAALIVLPHMYYLSQRIVSA